MKQKQKAAVKKGKNSIQVSKRRGLDVQTGLFHVEGLCWLIRRWEFWGNSKRLNLLHAPAWSTRLALRQHQELQSITRAVGTAGTESSWPLVLKDKHKHKLCSLSIRKHSLEYGGESHNPPAPAPAVADEAPETSTVCRLLRGHRGHVTAHSPLPSWKTPGCPLWGLYWKAAERGEKLETTPLLWVHKY